MSATIISEAMMVSTKDSSSSSSSSSSSITQAQIMEIQFVKCDCCGLTEECTPGYIERIRERYMGKWVCGLCSEAVKDEVIRSERLITTEEALNRHLNVCRKFRSSCPPAGGDPTAHLITAMRQILRRSRLRSTSTPASPTHELGERKRPVLARSESCFPDLG